MLPHAHANSQIRAFAKVALQGLDVLHNVNPDYKGYTLPQSGVEPYNYHKSNKDPNELLGQKLFLYMYVTNAVVALIVGIFILLPLLFRVYDRAAKRNNKFFSDPTRVQLFTVTLLASIYISAVYIADMYYYIKISYKYFNLFLILKLLFEVLVLVLLLFFYIVFNIIHVRCCHTEGKDYKTVFAQISRIAVIVPLTLAIVSVMLIIFPTLLLLFAHPMNTFSLIVIHVALFYTETMAGVLFIDQVYTCKPACTIGERLCKECLNYCTRTDTSSTTYTRLQSPSTCTKTTENIELDITKSGNDTDAGATESGNNTDTRATKSGNNTDTRATRHSSDTTEPGNTPYYNVALLLLGVIGMFFLGGVVYLSVMCFYQFLFLRNLSNNLAFDIIIKYIPSVGIAAFGYLIRKGAFSNEKKEDKYEKLWRKLGELLNIPKKQLDTLDDAKKQEISKLRSIFGQLLANNDQQPRQETDPSQETDLSQQTETGQET